MAAARRSRAAANVLADVSDCQLPPSFAHGAFANIDGSPAARVCQGPCLAATVPRCRQRRQRRITPRKAARRDRHGRCGAPARAGAHRADAAPPPRRHLVRRHLLGQQARGRRLLPGLRLHLLDRALRRPRAADRGRRHRQSAADEPGAPPAIPPPRPARGDAAGAGDRHSPPASFRPASSPWCSPWCRGSPT